MTSRLPGWRASASDQSAYTLGRLACVGGFAQKRRWKYTNVDWVDIAF